MKQSYIFTLLSAALLSTGCSFDELLEERGENVVAAEVGNITLNINKGSKPAGPRHQHVRDLGHAYDYHLHDLCLFIYEASGLSPISSAANTPLLYKAYLTEDKFTEHTDRVTDGHDGHEIDAYDVSANFSLPSYKRTALQQILVVANVGDITSECSTLGDVRKYQPAKAYTTTAGGYGNFAMGLYEEPSWSTAVNHDPTADEPHKINVTLERISARVDFALTQHPSADAQSADEHAPIPYNVVVGGNTLARNWITHARLVNAMQNPSYLIRRSASDATVDPNGSSVKYLGADTEVGSVASTTILTPYTADMSAHTAASLFGTTALETSRSVEFTNAERVVSRSGIETYGDGSGYYYILGYPQENTLRTDQMVREYATGVLYRTIFEPAKVWRLNAAGTDIVSETSELSEGIVSDGTAVASGKVGTHFGKTFWMMEELVPMPTEANRIYFMSDKADPALALDEVTRAINIYKEQHPEVGYTDAQKFTDGVTYNYYWLRHSPSLGAGHPFTAMEYSIVRNNIYSVKINSFSGPGAPSTDPTMDNPDRIQPITYVYPWHPYEVEEISM